MHALCAVLRRLPNHQADRAAFLGVRMDSGRAGKSDARIGWRRCLDSNLFLCTLTPELAQVETVEVVS
eukprot:m.1420715 g.1420715  ORF g.1420715 m.1420715 type:complete len:68 (-) comp25046_c0_seq6:160-363(-)